MRPVTCRVMRVKEDKILKTPLIAEYQSQDGLRAVQCGAQCQVIGTYEDGGW